MSSCWDHLPNRQNISGGPSWYSGILTNYEFNDEMVAIKSKCFDETVLCRIDNSLYRVSNCPFHAGDQSLRHSHRYPGVFLIRFFLNDERHATQKRTRRKCSLILNAEIELKPSLLRKDALMLNGSILLFWGCLESKTIKLHQDDLQEPV